MSPEELERRRNVVGASECGLLFGIPSYGNRTIADLWHEKKYGIERPWKGNASTDLGNKLEPVILEMAEVELKTRVIDRQLWLRSGSVAATLDGRLESTGAVIDAKTSGILGPHQLAAWGDGMSDDVPDNYLLQITAQMLATGAELGYIAALIGGRGFDLFRILPQPALMSAIELKAAAFIESLAGDVPPPEIPQLETLKRIRRQPDKVAPRCDSIDEAWLQLEEAKATAKESETAKDALQAKLLSLLGDCDSAEVSGGLLTFYEQSRKETWQAASTFRVLRFRKS